MGNTVSLYDMLQEMQTWSKTSQDILKKAKASKITNANSVEFQELVLDWSQGYYDEDPHVLVEELISLLHSKTSKSKNP